MSLSGLKSIVVSVFVKDDLIQAQINNLLQLEKLDGYKVIFYQDNTLKSPKYDSPQYAQKLDNVKAIIENNLHRFHNAKFFRNDTNITPCGMCKKSIDHAFVDSDYVIFMEDDVFLAKNALTWFNYFYDNKILTWDTYKFVTGESVFYDTKNMTRTPSDTELDTIKADITKNSYQQYFIELDNFITSSIFATTKSIWNTEIRDTRGMRNGANALNDLINKNKWKSIFPVVPFAKDIGMLHNDGWSVAWHGVNGVREIKNTYLLADEFPSPCNFVKVPKSIQMSTFYPFKII
jgi:hypothetical protein